MKIFNVAFFLSLFLFSALVSFSQNNLSGTIKDSDGKLPIRNAVVMILSADDSTLLDFRRTDENGHYEFNKLPSGKAILMISHPLYAGYVDDINVKSGKENQSSVSLTGKSKMLEAIIIKTGGAIKIKGDTTIYTADSFNVSANANVEELLRKLPGIQVDKNGDIKAMGEKVQKVLVDGEEFFGDDPGMAVKNLRADAVKEVQVFDKKSEQAAFTGIDDGKTQKTINLKLKEDRKRGYFGKVSLSGGIGEAITNRFNNNLLFGSFKGNRKLSAFVLNGNTGQEGLNWQESQKYGASEDNNFEMMDEDGIFSFNFTKSGDDQVYINPQNGFMRNVNAGLQYSNKWKDKNSVNFSPKYNEQDYYNTRDNRTVTQLGDSALIENAQTRTIVKRYNIQNSLIYDAKLDTSNSFKITLKYRIYHSESNEATEAVTTGNSGTLKNTSARRSDNQSDKYVLSGNAIFKHRFKKARRTLSVTADWNRNSNNSDNYLVSNNSSYFNAIPIEINVNQLTRSDNQADKISSRLVYTEPLTKKWAMEMAYELTLNNGFNNQSTFTVANGAYTDVVDSLSNDFKQKITIHTPSAKFNYAWKKIKFNFGSGFGITEFDLLDRTLNKEYIRNYINVFPSATFVYNYKSNHALRIKYNGYNTQPSFNQLQPLRNNNNLFNQYIGNPDLRPSFSSNFNITHNGYDFLKNLWNFQSLNVIFSENAITNNRIIDPQTGATISKPINTNGNVTISLWSGYGFKTKKYAIDMEISPSLNFSRFADVINNLVSFSNTTSGGLNLGMKKSKQDKYDISLNNQSDISYNTNAQTKTSNTFRSNTLSCNATFFYKKVWTFMTDYSYNARQNLSGQTGNFDVHIVNLKIQRTFKKNEYTVFVKANDLLNQNLGLDRSYYGNIFTEERNTRLKRYFMLGFSWDFKNKNVASKK